MLGKILNHLAEMGSHPTDSEETKVKKAILNLGFSAFALVLLLFLVPLYLYYDEIYGAVGYLVSAIATLLFLILFRFHRVSMGKFVGTMAYLALLGPLWTTIFLGGFINSGGVVLWGLLFPSLGMLIFHDTRKAIPWFIAFLLNVATAIAMQPLLRPQNRLPTALNMVVLTANIIIISCFIFFIFAYFIDQRNLAYRLLHAEQEKSQSLLLNILPEDIATILKNEKRVIADHFEAVTILFADIAGFTPISARMSPVDLVVMLNEVFSHFDDLAEKYQVEKIKTIGDCYMAACGVPRPRPDHANTIVAMALEMTAFVREKEFNGRRLNFRIGINSGPVVGGVIGNRKFIYDLWGDAVNTASRMESIAQTGSIAITRTTYELVQNDFECASKGLMAVKGKGDLEVWEVIGLRPRRQQAFPH